MGMVKVGIGVGNLSGKRFEEVEVTVATGTFYTQVPGGIERLGVRVSETADLDSLEAAVFAPEELERQQKLRRDLDADPDFLQLQGE